MSAVDDAIERAEKGDWGHSFSQIEGDLRILAAEVKRLRDLARDAWQQGYDDADADGPIRRRPNPIET